jgi:hypothetical protein
MSIRSSLHLVSLFLMNLGWIHWSLVVLVNRVLLSLGALQSLEIYIGAGALGLYLRTRDRYSSILEEQHRKILSRLLYIRRPLQRASGGVRDMPLRALTTTRRCQ